jgi:hypothetical protein
LPASGNGFSGSARVAGHQISTNTRGLKMKVGDNVRFIFLSYRDLLKSDYDQIYSVSNQNNNESLLSLGGIYEIKEIKQNKWGIIIYRLLDLDEYYAWQPESNIKQVDDIMACPYTLDQTLTFHPKSSEDDIDALPSWKKEIAKCNKFVLSKILNNYYIYVKNNDGNEFQFPFLWYDFELVD